ncbi:hypothetical protein [Amycolatopsis thermoflava]|uniref:hypothetical protein n=1 Tax=Amycolatopsis thermoflava TaxID=84480 RepID=UPI003EB8957C
MLPLHCESADLVLFNPLVVIDALDEENSKVFRLPSTNKVADVQEPRFFRESVEENLVFMVPQLVAKGEIFFTTCIVERIEATGLSANVRFVAAMD